MTRKLFEQVWPFPLFQFYCHLPFGGFVPIHCQLAELGQSGYRRIAQATRVYIDALDSELKELFLMVRSTVIEAAPGLNEEIKWKNCLTYSQERNIIQTVVGKQHISLIFFDGVKLKDPDGLQEGEGNKTRTAKITAKNFKPKALAKLVKQAVLISKRDALNPGI